MTNFADQWFPFDKRSGSKISFDETPHTVEPHLGSCLFDAQTHISYQFSEEKCTEMFTGDDIISTVNIFWDFSFNLNRIVYYDNFLK